MKPWTYALIVCLPFGSVIALAIWLRRRWLAQARTSINDAIPPLSRRHYRFTGSDEELQVQAERRRAHADVKRGEAAQIASGHQPEDRMRIVRGHR